MQTCAEQLYRTSSLKKHVCFKFEATCKQIRSDIYIYLYIYIYIYIYNVISPAFGPALGGGRGVGLALQREAIVRCTLTVP